MSSKPWVGVSTDRNEASPSCIVWGGLERREGIRIDLGVAKVFCAAIWEKRTSIVLVVDDRRDEVGKARSTKSGPN